MAVEGKQEGTLGAAASCCQVDQPNVFLLTLKQAEDGDGIILRLIETEGRAVTATVTLPLWNVEKALRTNLVEENQGDLAFLPHAITTPIRPFETVTVRVRPQR